MTYFGSTWVMQQPLGMLVCAYTKYATRLPYVSACQLQCKSIDFHMPFANIKEVDGFGLARTLLAYKLSDSIGHACCLNIDYPIVLEAMR